MLETLACLKIPFVPNTPPSNDFNRFWFWLWRWKSPKRGNISFVPLSCLNWVVSGASADIQVLFWCFTTSLPPGEYIVCQLWMRIIGFLCKQKFYNRTPLTTDPILRSTPERCLLLFILLLFVKPSTHKLNVLSDVFDKMSWVEQGKGLPHSPGWEWALLCRRGEAPLVLRECSTQTTSYSNLRAFSPGEKIPTELKLFHSGEEFWGPFCRPTHSQQASDWLAVVKY